MVNNIKIQYSKRKAVLALILYSLLLSFIWTIGINEGLNITKSILLIIVTIFSYPLFKRKIKTIRKKHRKNIIIISIDGISTLSSGFIRWEDIRNEDVIAKGGNGLGEFIGTDYFLKFETKHHKVIEVPVEGLTKNVFQIKKILRDYRDYHKKHFGY